MQSTTFALTTLSLNPEYFEETIALIEREFYYDNNYHFEIDFAPLMNPLNFENCFLLIDEESNSVAAHLAVCERVAIKNGIRTPVAIIGGIVTDKKFRGQKLFKKLMDHALNEFSSRVSLFILWSEIESLYEKFGFSRAGGLIETGNSVFGLSDRPAGFEKTSFNQLSSSDFEQIVSLYKDFNEKYFFTLTREDKEWSIIKEMKSIDLYLKRNLEGNIIKYFCVNKGRDLTSIIHEISALNENEFQSLLKDVDRFKLWVPESESLRFSAREIFFTAFIKLGSEKLFDDFLAQITDGELSIIKRENQLVHFKYNSETHIASEQDFIQYVLGPRPLEEFTPYKLSLYICGADSI
jgi:predicted N-acetyltransferase YhbS